MGAPSARPRAWYARTSAARPFQPVEPPHPRRLIRPASRATRPGTVVRSSRWPAPPICWT